MFTLIYEYEASTARALPSEELLQYPVYVLFYDIIFEFLCIFGTLYTNFAN